LEGPCHAAALNGANEEAVYACLRGEIGFLDIETLVTEAVKEATEEKVADYKALAKADALAREFVLKEKGRFAHGLV
jgi:1-deoxy-D-xylulose 5-phosphate reductoisomerase